MSALRLHGKHHAAPAAPSHQMRSATSSARRPSTCGRVVAALLQALLFFVPSFLRFDLASDSKQLHETAYLDGLRGYACYAVFFYHYTVNYCTEVQHAYENSPSTSHYFQLPIVRLVYNGNAAVTVFFVLSGYVLSYKPLRLIHEREWEKLQACLGSSIFRRWGRLFIPVLGLWALNVLLVEFGAYAWFDAYRAADPDIHIATVEEYLERGETFFGTVANAYQQWMHFSHSVLYVWTNAGEYPSVDGHMWTLHVEFRCSCILFLYLHGTSRMRPNLRLGFFLLSAIVSLVWDEWAIATFLAGSAIADIDLRMRRRALRSPQPTDHAGVRAQEEDIELLLPSASPSRSSLSFDLDESKLPASRSRQSLATVHKIFSRLQTFFCSSHPQIIPTLVFFISLVLMSFPFTDASPSSPYHPLSLLHPNTSFFRSLFFFCSLGSALLVYSTSRLPVLQRLLTSPFSQYIGKTSFALYLVHGSVIRTLGHRLVILCWTSVTGYERWGFAWGILAPMLPVAAVVVWAADCFWRAVDAPSVSFVRWVEGLVVGRN